MAPRGNAPADLALFPPAPIGLKGRAQELVTLSKTILAAEATRIALVGSGGSGKSMLACALGHELSKAFSGRVHWFRVGSWDFYTLTEMLALQFGIRAAEDRVAELLAHFRATGPRLIVLDNHEDDRALARFLDAFSDSPVSFVITARRCLLAGVFIFPVTAPLVTSGESAFPRVATLTRLLRFNPLALDLADSFVQAGDASPRELGDYLVENGVTRVVAIEHEDDLPEIALLVNWAFGRLSAASQRMLAVLAHVEGDHVDRDSLSELAAVRRGREAALDALTHWHLVQEPVEGRFALHAVVRHALRRRTSFEAGTFFEYYVALLERHPERLLLEHTHLFAAMDHAHRKSDLGAMLRVQSLMQRIREEQGAEHG